MEDDCAAATARAGAVFTVVLAEKQHRQFIKRCQIESFRRGAFFERAVAEQSKR
mgnify:CR=1 FL=1